MQNHLVHLHMIWSWDQITQNTYPGWHVVEQEMRVPASWDHAPPEVMAQQEFNSNIGRSTEGSFELQSYGKPPQVVWPGGAHHPADRYYVATYGWNPGMPNWELQYAKEIVHRPLQSASGFEDPALPTDQINQLQVPDDGFVPPKQTTSKTDSTPLVVAGVIAAIALGAGLIVLVGSDS